MNIFRKFLNKRAAKKIAKQINVSENEIFAFLQSKKKLTKTDYKNFALETRAKIKNLPVDVYTKILKEEGDYLTYKEFTHKYLAKQAGLSYDEYKEFLIFKERNLGKNGINDENITDYFKASLLNLDIKYYYKYIQREDKSLSPEDFLDREMAKEKGISLEEYLVIKEAEKLNLTIKEYNDYLYAKSKGLSLDSYYYLEYLNSESFNNNEFVPVSNNDELVAVNKAKFKNIILLKTHNNKEYKVSLFKDKNVVISNGLDYIDKSIIKVLMQESIIIPESVKNIDKEFFLSLEHSGIRRVYILADVKIRGKFPNNDKQIYLKPNVIKELKYEPTIHFDPLLYDDNLSSIGAFICVEEKKCYFIPGTNITSDLSILNNYDIVNIEISPCVNILNDNAFANLQKVKHIIIKDKLTNIRNIILPNGCSILNDNSFVDCVTVTINKKKVTFNNVLLIDEGVQEISDYEYYGINCSSVIIPESVKKIGKMAFKDSQINYLYFKGTLEYKQDSFLFCNILEVYQDEPFINSSLGFGWEHASHLDLDGIAVIKEGAFTNLNIKNIVIPNSVKEIETYGISSKDDYDLIIEGDIKLHKFSFGGKINSIVFKKISKDNVIEFISNAKLNLTSVTLPSNVDIETFKLFFTQVKSLKNIYLTGTEKPSLTSRGIFDVRVPDQFEHIEFPECISAFDKNTFCSSSTKIKNLVFPDNIVNLEISRYVFKDKNINIIGSKELLEKINKKIEFKYKLHNPSLIDVVFIDVPSDFEKITLAERGLIQEIVVGEKIEEIPNYAFAYMTHLIRVTFKGLIKKIGEYSFAYCNRLAFIELSPTTNKICKGAFLGDFSLEKITGFDSVEVVEKSAFENCVNLKSLIFSSSIRVIENCIKGCFNLKLFVVPNSCDKIDLEFEAKRSNIYLPRFIHDYNLKTYLSNYEYPTVHCPRNKNWSFSTNYKGYSTYKLEDFKNAVNKIIKPYGYSVLEIDRKKKLKDYEDDYVYDDNTLDALKLHSSDSGIGRASFNVISKAQTVEDFTVTPTSISDIIEKLEVNNDLQIEIVDRKNSTGSYDVINNDGNISFDNKYKLITNNIFPIQLNINGKYSNIYVGIINNSGVLITGLYKVLLDEKRCIAKISMSLLPGSKNGKYYFIVSSSNTIEDNIIFKEEVEIKIAFSIDDDFDL